MQFAPHVKADPLDSGCVVGSMNAVVYADALCDVVMVLPANAEYALTAFQSPATPRIIDPAPAGVIEREILATAVPPINENLFPLGIALANVACAPSITTTDIFR